MACINRGRFAAAAWMEVTAADRQRYESAERRMSIR